MSILDNYDQYCRWRDVKLNTIPKDADNYLVEIDNPEQLSNAQKQQILINTNAYNFSLLYIKHHAHYHTNLSANISDKNAITNVIVALNAQLKLKDYDSNLYAKHNGLSYIKQSTDKNQQDFIPYTNKALKWHTDGYYNNDDSYIRSFSMYCVQNATNGGENSWFDYDIAYILLREQNPELANALCANNSFIIPQHTVDGVVRRAKFSGAVFLIDNKTNKLTMRYSQRTHNIIWSNDVVVAKDALDNILATNTEYRFNHKLDIGQALVCNNILHNRAAFITENPPRLMLRGRYFNSIG